MNNQDFWLLLTPVVPNEWMELTNEIMNKQTNEQTNEWTNECTNEWMNERTNRINKRNNEQTNEQTNECTNAWMNEWTNEGMNKQTNEQMIKQTNAQMNEWMNTWINEWPNFHFWLKCLFKKVGGLQAAVIPVKGGRGWFLEHCRHFCPPNNQPEPNYVPKHRYFTNSLDFPEVKDTCISCLF